MGFLKWLGGVIALFGTLGLMYWGWGEGGFWRLLVVAAVAAGVGYIVAEERWSKKHKVNEQAHHKAWVHLTTQLRKSQQRVTELEEKVASSQVEMAQETHRRWPV